MQEQHRHNIQSDVLSRLIEIFNDSQHETSSNEALKRLKKLYKTTEFNKFEEPLKVCVRKLLQSKHTIYFKSSCAFLCKFLQHVHTLGEELKSKERGAGASENTAPENSRRRGQLNNASGPAPSKSRLKRKATTKKRATKRKATEPDDDDEILGNFTVGQVTDADIQTDPLSDDDPLISESINHSRRSSTSSSTTVCIITDHDRIISACIDVADAYLRLADEGCRLNAVVFVCKFLSHVDSLDEEIVVALKGSLAERVRDKKPMIRAQAILASRKFQDNKLTHEGFTYHAEHDPEPMVRKALLQVMDTKIFGYKYLVNSTQDSHEAIRKAAFLHLAKVDPRVLKTEELQAVIHNGLNERERSPSYAFRTSTLESWLSILYDGIDLYKLMEHFDVVNNFDDVSRLLESIYERNSEATENNGATTKLHHVVETFRDRWLCSQVNCIPKPQQLDDKLVAVWLTLVKYCKKNRLTIKSIKIREPQQQFDDQNVSLEKILDSQERTDELAELYERLTPDLINVVKFLRTYIQHVSRLLRSSDAEVAKFEFVYQQLMTFICSYEVGDEIERKTVQEVFGLILKENLLTSKFENFIPPVVRALSLLTYPNNPHAMVNYVSELIQNVRSHLEDLVTSSQAPPSTIKRPETLKRGLASAKKVRISSVPVRRTSTVTTEIDNEQLEYKIAKIRVDIEELKDKLDSCIKDKDFDQAKKIDSQINDLKAELDLLHGRRCSIASDVSHLSMVGEDDEANYKLSSTMIGDASFSDEPSAAANKEDLRMFVHHPNELVKCLQMFYGCIQSVNLSQLPITMHNHLSHLTYEGLDTWFKDKPRIMSLIVACNGIAAFVDKSFALNQNTVALLMTGCFEENLEISASSFKHIVDILCQHEDFSVHMPRLIKFLLLHLRDHGKYDPRTMKKEQLDFYTVLIEGCAKLFYCQRLAEPKVLAHLIVWWYHPKTPSKLKQFIGIFLPMFVNDRVGDEESNSRLRELLVETFVSSIQCLHDHITGTSDYKFMTTLDMQNMISFLCNLTPITFHKSVIDRLDDRIDDLDNKSDSCKFLRQAKNQLLSMNSTTTHDDTQSGIANPINQSSQVV